MANFLVTFVLITQTLLALNVAEENNNTITTCDKIANETCIIDCSIQNCDYAVIDRYYFQDIDMIIDCQRCMSIYLKIHKTTKQTVLYTATCTSIHIIWPDLMNSVPKNLALLCGQSGRQTPSCSQAIVEVARAYELKIECYGLDSCEYLTFIFNGNEITHLHLRFFQTSPPSRWINVLNEDEKPLTVISRNYDVFANQIIGSLTLECAEQGCTQSLIDLERVRIDTASVFCSYYESCSAAKWSFNMRSHMDIHLGSMKSLYDHYSYTSMISVNLLNDINDARSGSLYVECQNCDTLNLEVSSSQSVWDKLPSTESHFNNVTIKCWSCREENWQHENGFVFVDVDVIFECQKDACFRTEIDASNANSLQLLCDGESSCFENEVHCPAHHYEACHIECSDNDQSCHHSKVYVDNDYTSGYLDWNCSFNTSLEEQNQCLIEFNCIDYGDETTKLPTNLTWNATSSSYECEHGSSEYCCPNQPNATVWIEFVEVPHSTLYVAQPWNIVGIVFICAFVIALGFAAYLLCKLSKKNEYEQTSSS